MSKMLNVFTNIPFFRIIIPFVLGILFAIKLNPNPLNLVVFIAIITLAIYLKAIKAQSKFTKRGFLILLDVFFFLLAINIVNNVNTKFQPNFYGNFYKYDSANYYIATINELPITKEKFIKCQLKINELKTDSGYKPVNGNIIGYFTRSDFDYKLQVGATILVKSKFLEISSPQNPNEFDYKTYLNNKQIYHTTFIAKGAFEVLDIPNQLNPIWYKALLIKQSILHQLKNSQLSENAYGICSALLTGYDDEIDKQIVESFSHSGTLHVLSVSGLHTGLIYLVLSLIFDLFDRKRKYKLSKFFLITIFLWGFALITGFSAPVLRAVIMFNLLGFGKIFFRSDSRNQINILLVSAFVLLCYNPFFITDVGFLLSYFALLGLIYFQPKLEKLWQPKNIISNWFWQGTTTSFAATIGTLPLTLFYFKQFPIWFFVCNLAVVPASFLILLLGFLIILKISFAAIIINYLTNWLITFITLFNSAKYGFIDNIDFSWSDAIFLSILIILISISIQTKSYKQIAFSVVILIGWQVFALANSFNSKNENLFIVYQINKKHTVLVKNKTKSTINELDSSQFMYHVKPHINSFNNSRLFVKEFNFIAANHKNILILNEPNYWPNISLVNIEILVLANNFSITQSDLEALRSLKTIVVDGSNNNFAHKKIEELSRKFEIELVKTKQKGAFILNLE